MKVNFGMGFVKKKVKKIKRKRRKQWQDTEEPKKSGKRKVKTVKKRNPVASDPFRVRGLLR